MKLTDFTVYSFSKLETNEIEEISLYWRKSFVEKLSVTLSLPSIFSHVHTSTCTHGYP